MKIKTDFVTNSSSTGYIVAVPKDFIPDPDEVVKIFREHFDDFDNNDQPWEPSHVVTEFNECLDILKSGDNIWYYGDDGTDSRIFHTMTEICENKGFTFAVFEIGGEGNNRIEGIKEDDVNKWFMNTQLKKLEVEVPDEQN